MGVDRRCRADSAPDSCFHSPTRGCRLEAAWTLTLASVAGIVAVGTVLCFRWQRRARRAGKQNVVAVAQIATRTQSTHWGMWPMRTSCEWSPGKGRTLACKLPVGWATKAGLEDVEVIYQLCWARGASIDGLDRASNTDREVIASLGLVDDMEGDKHHCRMSRSLSL